MQNILRFLGLLCGIMILPVGVWAQISQELMPPSFSNEYIKGLEVPVEKMRPVQVEKLLKEDRIADTLKNIPWRFGDNIQVNLHPGNAGRWDLLENGDKLWRVSVASPGAYSLNLTFNRYHLPPGAQLFVYNEDLSTVLGAFTDFNNQSDGYFATTLVEGDFITIEYYEPKGVDFPGELQLEMVTHAYRDPFSYSRGFGDSGWCNLNVACPEAEGWEQQIRSVAMLVTGGNGFCTGVVVNNSNWDEKPYVLSADHCYRNPSTVVFWFNWQSPTCENPVEIPPYQSMSGAYHRARNGTSDFWLMELMQPVPEEYHVFYAGWNRTDESSLNDTVIGVHHPRGDIKKFSYAENGVHASSYLGNPGSGTSHWRLTWSGGTTTEPASSGSPLFDGQGRILGQLHGGGAACGNTLPDWYGRFAVSWVGGGTPDTRLSDWLDPHGTDLITLEGLDPIGIPIADVALFEAIAQYDGPIELQWELNPDQNPVMIAVNTENAFGKPQGSYTLGEEIEGGGQVLYLGNETSFLHENLMPEQSYYYKIWSYNVFRDYAAGVSATATTSCAVITSFPYAEGFNTQELPDCWLHEFVIGETSWQTGAGNNEGFPEAPWEGDYNIFFKVHTVADQGNTSRMISPVFDLSTYEQAQLSFYYANPASFANQDILRVYFRSQESQEWVLLQTFSGNQPTWTHVQLDIPVLSSLTQIAFEAEGRRGHGVSIDLAEVLAFAPDLPSPQNLSLQMVNDNEVQLHWEHGSNTPSSGGFNIYRNSLLIHEGHDPQQTSFQDQPLPVGDFSYFVIYRNQDGVLSGMSNEVTASVQPEGDEVELVISLSGQGLTLLPPGVYQYKPGSEVVVSAIAADFWQLAHWLVNGQEEGEYPEITLTLNDPTQLKAVFQKQSHALQLEAEPVEGAQNLSGQGTYEHGAHVTVSAEPALGYVFLHWKHQGQILSTLPDMELIVHEPKALTAYFQPFDFVVQAVVHPEGAGVATGGGVFPAGEQVVLEATPEDGWRFKHWSATINQQYLILHHDPLYSFPAYRDLNIQAHFEVFYPQLSISVQGSGTTIPEPGLYSYEPGEEVQLTAIPHEDIAFVNWLINGQEFTELEISLIMEEDIHAVAVFEGANLVPENHKPSLKVYPVPASSELYVVFPQSGNWDVQLVHITGQLAQRISVAAMQSVPAVLPLHEIPAGIYILRAQYRGLVIHAPIVVQD